MTVTYQIAEKIIRSLDKTCSLYDEANKNLRSVEFSRVAFETNVFIETIRY